MVKRADVVAKAREYMNTPFKHQGRVKGVGCDCAGLLICVARDLALKDVSFDISNYGRLPTGDEMRWHLREHMVELLPPVNPLTPGDVLLMRFEREPQHIAIVTEENYLIHSYAQIRRVTEHRIDDVWQSRICAVFCFREFVE